MDSEQNTQVEHNLTNHTPDEEGIKSIEALRAKAKEFGRLINEVCPNSREKSLAQTNLEQALMWANASLPRHQ